jgi:hypothetical protein
LAVSAVATPAFAQQSETRGRGVEQRSDRADERSRRPAAPPGQAKKADDDETKKAEGSDKTKAAAKPKKANKAKTDKVKKDDKKTSS